MSSEQIAVAIVRALEAENIPYMLVGSFSTNAYGIPRSTKDIDLVVELEGGAIRKLSERLGPDFKLDPQMTFESVTMTVRHIIEVIGSSFQVEIFHLSQDPHDQERFRRRRRLTLDWGSAVIATPEDVIITKLNWYGRQRRTRDCDDIRDVLAVQGAGLDFDYIHSWCERHGTRQLLDEIRASIPPID
jgi:hypothetical protein